MQKCMNFKLLYNENLQRCCVVLIVTKTKSLQKLISGNNRTIVRETSVYKYTANIQVHSPKMRDYLYI